MARSVLQRRQTRGPNEMTALELIDVANQVLFIGLFAAVLWRALKQPSRAAWDTVLLFGSIAGVVFLARAARHADDRYGAARPRSFSWASSRGSSG